MADKYCDHGLYGAAVVVGSTSGSSTTLTIASVTSGTLGLGAMITGTGIAANTYISALGTGTGGTGTYTMNQANNISAGTTITASYGGPALVPNWGVAQEGDGTAIGAATPATISVDMSALTANAGDTISVGGATITCVASGATTNQFNAGTGTTLIDNIVTGINRATNTVTVSAAATGWGTPKIQDCVYAQRNGNNLEIMTRAGSSVYNSNAAWKVLSAGLSPSNIDVQFSGGAGGAWGYVANERTTAWPSAIAIVSYGLWASQYQVAGTVTPGDTVHIRNNKTTGLITTGNTAYTLSVTLPQASPSATTVYQIDDGTAWAGDSSTGVFTFYYLTSATNGGSLTFRLSAHNLLLRGTKLGVDDYSLKLENRGTATGGASLIIGATANAIFDKFNLTATSSANVTCYITNSNIPSGSRPKFANFCIKKSNNGYFITTVNSAYGFTLENATVDNTGNSGTGTVFALGGNVGFEIQVFGLICKNFVVGSVLCSSAYTRLSIINPIFGNVSSRGPYLYTGVIDTDYASMVSVSSQIGGRDFSIDTSRGFVEWNSTTAQPTLNAVLPDGTTKWSMKLLPHTVGPDYPLIAPRIAVINTLADGARTFVIEFCVNKDWTWTKRDVSVLLVYEDTSGELVTIDTYDPYGGALDTSTSVWSRDVSSSQVEFTVPAQLLHNKYKFTVNTVSGKNLKQGAEVGVFFRVHSPYVTNTQYVFVDPYVSIT